MKIFIDESGSFAHPTGDKSSISSVGVLCIPSHKYPKLEDAFTELTKDWPKDVKGEVKGKNLSEAQVIQIIPILKRADCIFEVAAIDLSKNTLELTQEHKKLYADGFIRNLKDTYHPNLINYAHGLKDSLLELSDNLYVQTVLTNTVVYKTLQHSVLYYCQRKPSELGNFEWIIDAKEPNKITPYEKWWKEAVSPSLQSKSLIDPGMRVVASDFNYSYFDKSFLGPMPDYLKELIPETSKNRESSHDLKAILTKNLKFDVSENHIGLQLVDILTNTINRALKGNFTEAGWLPLGELMIRGRDKLNVSFLTFGNDKKMQKSQAYILKKLAQAGKAMIALI